MRLRAGLFFTAFLLASCDHHKPGNQAQSEAGNAAVAQDDSELTGMPAQKSPSTAKTYPRAQLVSLPPVEPVLAPAPAAASAPSQSSKNPGTPPVPSESPAMTAAPAPNVPPPESALAPIPPPPPVIDTPAPRLAASPTPAPNPSPATDDAPAQSQVVVLKTSMGNIVIELDTAAAPLTCGNFRKLVSDGYYNHTTFHRVIPNFIIQGGDPNSRSDKRSTYGQGGPGYKLPAEIKLTHDEGAVAMARLPDNVNPQRQSNGSQFYICLENCPSLDAKYTVFGHVIKGIDVAKKIGDQPHDSRDNPLQRIEMEASLEPKNKALNDSDN